MDIFGLANEDGLTRLSVYAQVFSKKAFLLSDAVLSFYLFEQRPLRQFQTCAVEGVAP